MKNKRSKTSEEANDEFRNAFNTLCLGEDSVRVKDIAKYLKMVPQTVYGRVNHLSDEYELKKGRIWRVEALRNKALQGKATDE